MRRGRRALVVACCLCLAGVAAAQDPPKPDPPVDPSAAAAEALRRMLGLEPGPAKDTLVQVQRGVPQGPPPPPGFRFDPTAPAPPFGPPPPAGEIPLPPPENPPRKTEPPGADTPEQAAGALTRLMPDAKPVTEPPVRTREPPPVPPPQDQAKPAPVVDEARIAADHLRATDLGTVKPRPTDEPKAPSAFAVHGSLSTRYRLRAVGSDNDQELTTYLDVSIGSADVDPFSLHLSGRGYADLDGAERNSRLRGIEDSYGEAVTGRLYHAHLDLHVLPGFEVARAGRQTLDDTPISLHFDGARLQTDALGRAGLWAQAYVGAPVHLFESARSGDLLGGVAAGVSPWNGGRARVDWLHLEDRVRTGTRRDDLLGLSLWQDLGAGNSLRLDHTRLGSEARDLTAHLRGDGGDLGLRGNLRWYQLLEPQRALVTELDPYFEALFEQDPFHQVRLDLDQDLAGPFGITAGLDVRRLEDASRAGIHNREFERYSVGPRASRLFGGALDLGVTGDWWQAGAEDVRTLSANAAWRLNESTTLTAASTYLMYKLDVLSGIERDHVRVWSLRLTHRPERAWRFDLRYDLENADLATFHTFSAGMTWKF